jgi:hypothetical protein
MGPLHALVVILGFTIMETAVAGEGERGDDHARRFPDHAITNTPLDGAGVDVAGDADVAAHDIFPLLVNTRFAYAGRDKKKQTDLILSVGRAASQTHREGSYAVEVRAGHAKISQAAYNFIRNAHRALFGLLDKAPGTYTRARRFLTLDWQRPSPPQSSMPADRTTDASDICAECSTEGPPRTSTNRDSPSEPQLTLINRQFHD